MVVREVVAKAFCSGDELGGKLAIERGSELKPGDGGMFAMMKANRRRIRLVTTSASEAPGGVVIAISKDAIREISCGVSQSAPGLGSGARSGGASKIVSDRNPGTIAECVAGILILESG